MSFVRSSTLFGVAMMAAVVGSASVQKASAAVVVDVTSLGTLSSNTTSYPAFTAYTITLTSDTGAITGIDFGGMPGNSRGLFGSFLQRAQLSVDPDTEAQIVTLTPYAPQKTNAASASLDSHFVTLPVGTSLLPVADPSEDNSFTNPVGGPADTLAFNFGSGTSLTGTYGLSGTQPTSLTVAYVVLPTGESGSYSGRIATAGGTFDVSGSITAVPEPTTIGALAAAGLLALRRRR